MNRFKISAVLLLSCLFLTVLQVHSVDRKPLPRPVLKKRMGHRPTGTRFRHDPKAGKSEEYQVNGEVIYDERTGNFLFRWTGRDGQRKTIVYEPANKLDAVVEVGAVHIPEDNGFRYSYILTNLPSSTRKLQSLYLETQAPVRDAKAPDNSWYSRPLTPYLKGVFKVSAGWGWSDTLWARAGLLPGEKVEGMSFLSPGLPGIVRCFVRNYRDAKGVGEEMPEELVDAIAQMNWEIPQGVTVGPVEPPQRLQPAAFARKILEMLEVSVEQGWIESPNVAQVMRVLLGNAAAAFDRGELERASDLLESLLKQVEEENEQTLLSEAYALLKFNVEFLQTHLGRK